MKNKIIRKNKALDHSFLCSWLLSAAIFIISTALSLLAADHILFRYEQWISESSVIDPGLLRHHPRLGWVLTPGWRGKHRHRDFRATYEINPFGFRGSSGEYGQSKDRHIVLLGDSFTFGLGVNEGESFTDYLALADPDTEYLNFGVPGYSTDQEYLLQQEVASNFRPEIYLLMLYLGNDLVDNMLSVPLQVQQEKPLYRLTDDDKLILANVPVPSDEVTRAHGSVTLESIVYGDALAQAQNPLGQWLRTNRLLERILPPPHLRTAELQAVLEDRLIEQKRLQIALLRAMSEDATAHGGKLVLALLPGMSYVTSPGSPSALFQDHVRLFMISSAAANHLTSIDVAGSMRELYEAGGDHDWFFPNEGHYTPDGHRIVAGIIRRGLNLAP
ncbi:MAG TPA: SGNH/GDSL hydrolase family protein [Gammaproteobacteria bacterium]|nr:SGNH/GDSL hydrolase family protein [Gammaproteobacteria bacterium]